MIQSPNQKNLDSISQLLEDHPLFFNTKPTNPTQYKLTDTDVKRKLSSPSPYNRQILIEPFLKTYDFDYDYIDISSTFNQGGSFIDVVHKIKSDLPQKFLLTNLRLATELEDLELLDYTNFQIFSNQTRPTNIPTLNPVQKIGEFTLNTKREVWTHDFFLYSDDTILFFDGINYEITSSSNDFIYIDIELINPLKLFILQDGFLKNLVRFQPIIQQKYRDTRLDELFTF